MEWRIAHDRMEGLLTLLRMPRQPGHNPDNVALRGGDLLNWMLDYQQARARIAELEQRAERAERERDRWAEREAAVCPEDVPFEEFIGRLLTERNRLERERDEALADRDECRATLAMVEWDADPQTDRGDCRWCLKDRAEGHEKDCIVGAILSDARPPSAALADRDRRVAERVREACAAHMDRFAALLEQRADEYMENVDSRGRLHPCPASARDCRSEAQDRRRDAAALRAIDLSALLAEKEADRG